MISRKEYEQLQSGMRIQIVNDCRGGLWRGKTGTIARIYNSGNFTLWEVNKIIGKNWYFSRRCVERIISKDIKIRELEPINLDEVLVIK